MSEEEATEQPLDPNEIMTKQTIVQGLMKVCVETMKQMPDIWAKTPEEEQERLLDFIEDGCREVALEALEVLNGVSRTDIFAKVESVTFKDGIKAVLKVSGNAEGRHELADREGLGVRIVLLDDEVIENQGHNLEAEPDQADMLEDGGMPVEDGENEGEPTEPEDELTDPAE